MTATMTVNRERVRLLVNELADSKFIQGQGQLKDATTGKLCCLGVACEVAIANGLEVRTLEMHPSTGNVRSHGTYDGAAAAMPYSVQQWYGFPEGDPKLCDLRASLWNDVRSYSFARISALFAKEFL